MSGPYFQRQRWQPFTFDGKVYPLDHLDEYHINVADSKGVSRKIVVTFSDHCFTKPPEPNDNPGLIYHPSSRNPGYFCIERYNHSLSIHGHIDEATKRVAWHLGHDSYAIVPTVDHRGIQTLYGIVFSLDPVRGLPVELHMRVKSAHPRDERELDTFGSVRFAHLITLRMEKKHPNRITSRHRKRPRPR